MLAKLLLKQCVKYLIEYGFDNTSRAKGVFVFLRKDTFEISRLKILEDEVFYEDKKSHHIEGISNLVQIITDKYDIEYQKHHRLNIEIVKVANDVNYLNDHKNWIKFLDEINNALIESRLSLSNKK